MNFKNYKIQRTNNQIRIFKKFNNIHEIAEFGMNAVQIAGFGIFVVFGSIAFSNEKEFTLSLLFIIPIFLFLFWYIFLLTKALLTNIKRIIIPILIIENTIIRIQDEKGKTTILKITDVREIQAKIYYDIENLNYGIQPRPMFYTEITLYLNGDKHILFDIINPSTFFIKEYSASKELKENAKEIGSFLSKELNVPFFLTNKIIDASKTKQK